MECMFNKITKNHDFVASGCNLPILSEGFFKKFKIWERNTFWQRL